MGALETPAQRILDAAFFQQRKLSLHGMLCENISNLFRLFQALFRADEQPVSKIGHPETGENLFPIWEPNGVSVVRYSHDAGRLRNQPPW